MTNLPDSCHDDDRAIFLATRRVGRGTIAAKRCRSDKIHGTPGVVLRYAVMEF